MYGDAILEVRVDAIPETPHCMACQTKLEAQGRTYRIR
ncbi:MAG: TraR/DksA C4-type zinc finger protein [Rhodoferax sp.]|nr:TraR/DksA C4-type zinc finger protein [Rhodoferax sp.]